MRHRPTAADSGAAHADDLFRARLTSMLDLRHPLATLAQRMPWNKLEDCIVNGKSVPFSSETSIAVVGFS